MNFRVITFGSQEIDILNDNIDVNVIFENGEVFFATFITLKNIEMLFKNESYFWIENMLIVNDLKATSIRKAILDTIESNYFKDIFYKIGFLNSLDGFPNFYHELDTYRLNFII